MISQLIEQNMGNNGKRIKAFQALSGIISLEAADLDEKISLDFQGDRLIISIGLSHEALLTIHTDSYTILDLARVRVLAGLPWFFDGVGLSILWKLITGRLIVSGMLFHPIVLIRVTKVFSVG